MKRDQGPSFSLGFGVRSGQDPNLPQDANAPAPTSGVAAKALYRHPIAKFLATSAATMVGWSVAEKMMKGKGVRLIDQLGQLERGKPDAAFIPFYRKLQKTLDEYEGIHRDVNDVFKPSTDATQKIANWHIIHENKLSGASKDWTLRDELQQRLVHQARALPYTLPAAWITQRAIVDPLTTNQNEPHHKIKWYNPTDVIGDFAKTSLHNIFTLMLPIGVGGGLAKQSWRRLITYGDTGAQNQFLKNASLSLKEILYRFGQDAGNILGKAAALSQRSTGALATAFTEAANANPPFKDYLAQLGRSIKRGHHVQLTRDYFNSLRTDPYNVIFESKTLGPFAQFGRAFRRSWRENPFDAAITSGRRSAIESDAADLRLWGDPVRSPFFRERYKEEYANILVRQLAGDEISPAEARAFISKANLKVPMREKFPEIRSQNISDRIDFGEEGIFAHYSDEWREELGRRAGNPLVAERIFPAIQKADQEYSENFRTIAEKINRQWGEFRQHQALPGINAHLQHIGNVKLPHEMFNEWSELNESVALQKLAPHLGVSAEGDYRRVADTVRQVLESRGLDPYDIDQVRALLQSYGEVTPGWHERGFNLLGFKPLTIESALQHPGYFPQETTRSIQSLMNEIKAQSGGSALLTPVGKGIYETSAGRIVDLSIYRSQLRNFLDKMSDQFQIPLLHIPILRMLQYGPNRDITKAPFFQYIGAFGQKPFLNQGEDATGYVALRSHGAHSRLVALTQEGSSQALEGDSFKVVPTDRYSTWRLLRLPLHDQGQIPDTPVSGWKQRLRFDSDQPHSLFGLAGRLWGRKTDTANPLIYANRLLEGDWDDISRTDQAKGFLRFRRYIGNYTLPPNVNKADQFLGEEAQFDGMSLNEIRDPHELMVAIKARLDTDIESHLEDERGLAHLRRIQRRLGRHLERYEAAPAHYLEKAPPLTQRIIGLTSQEGRVRGDAYRYSLAYQGLLENQNAQLAVNRYTNLLQRLDDLENARKITGAEKIQARAALLASYMDELELKSYTDPQKRGYSLQQRQLDVRNLLAQNPLTEPLQDIGNYRLQGVHNWGPKWLKRVYGKNLSVAPYTYPGVEYNPFGSESVALPTFRTQLRHHPRRAISSVLGIGTWNNPEAFSGASLIPSVLVQRLNRYFGLAGAQLNETAFGGPLSMYNIGMVGMRVLPFVAGTSALLTADQTLGGIVNPPYPGGQKNYSPFFLGHAANAVAHAQIAGAFLLHGHKGAEEKREDLYSGEVPIRRGRYWMLSNQPFRGTRIEYFRPNWFRRMHSSYKFTPDLYGSPLEKLLYYDDFSPLRPVNPYKLERKTYNTRPYPITGEYFTGPWGPLTGFLNSTIGRILKPARMMHRHAVNAGLTQYMPVGQYGAYMPQQFPTRGGANVMIEPAPESGALPIIVPVGGVGGQIMPKVVVAKKGQGVPTGGGIAAYNDALVRVANVPRNRGKRYHKNQLRVINARYENAAYEPTPEPIANAPIRVIANAPAAPFNSPMVQAGELGYQAQEMAGIYGFGFSSVRGALGLGGQNFATQRPVLQASSRAYGTERSFWDLNLGGLGDLPLPIEGEFGNIEVSEIMRRFIPHKRREQTEINPIPNQLGVQYPWLPGQEGLVDLKHGDPFVSIPFGEARLPGYGYEQFHKLHPDKYGKYGLVDIHRILGDTSPYSQNYKDANRLINSQPLTPTEQRIVARTREKVKLQKQRHDWHPYHYADQKFKTVPITITGGVEGKPGEFYTRNFSHPIRLAGVRFNADTAPHLAPGAYEATYDTNRYPLWNNNKPGTIDVILERNGINLNKGLLDDGLGTPTDGGTPLDYNAQKSRWQRYLHTQAESWAHKNTFFNEKFVPWATPVEDWERHNVYGTTFPQWNHPWRDYIAPIFYKAANRNPFVSAGIMAFVGRLFARGDESKRVAGFIGATLGFATSLITNARTVQTGQRFIPYYRKQEMAAEENTDVLNYLRWDTLYQKARAESIQQSGVDPEQVYERGIGSEKLSPETLTALNFRLQMARTSYGANPFENPRDLIRAMPKRKRDYFAAALEAPLSDRQRILSTAPRLERRLLEAQWGMPVEKKPDLNEYFKEHELPPPEWEGFAANASSQDIQIKIAQSMGLDVSQMGYYPQQVQQANLTNPSYPNFNQSAPQPNVLSKLREIMNGAGGNYSIRPVYTPSGNGRITFKAGV